MYNCIVNQVTARVSVQLRYAKAISTFSRGTLQQQKLLKLDAMHALT